MKRFITKNIIVDGATPANYRSDGDDIIFDPVTRSLYFYDQSGDVPTFLPIAGPAYGQAQGQTVILQAGAPSPFAPAPAPIGLTGPTGPAGEAGLDGAPGPRGYAGPVGMTGAPGTAGPQGETGPQGEIGPAGPAGEVGETGAPGPRGPAGPVGCSGRDGETGPQGPAGPQGPTGPEGPTGPQGPVGADGMPGAQGETGPTGAAGATGPRGIAGIPGPRGPGGMDGATGPAGPQGETGAAGPAGPAGRDGFGLNPSVEEIQTADFTAIENATYYVDTTANPVAVDPPPPSRKDTEFCVCDYAGKAASNPITIRFGTQLSYGTLNNTYILGVPFTSATFRYVNAAIGWVKVR